MRHDDLRDELKKLERSGKLTAEQVVEAASDRDSLLHDSFEWDDTKAAHAHRIETARTLIRSLRFTVETLGRLISPPTYIRDQSRPTKTQGYIAITRLKSRRALAKETVLAEADAASGHMKRARDIATYLGLSEEVDRVEQQLSALTESVEATD
jgi:hypothetical protein